MLTHIQGANEIFIRVDGTYSSKGTKSFLYNTLSQSRFTGLYFLNITDGGSLINLFTDLRPIKHFQTLAISNCAITKMFDASDYFDKITGIYLRNARAQIVLKYLYQVQVIQLFLDGGSFGLTEYDNQLYVGHIVNNAAVLRILCIHVKSKENFQYFSRFLRIFKPQVLNYAFVSYTNLNDEQVKYRLSYGSDEMGKRKLVRNLLSTNINMLSTILEEDKPEHFLTIDSLNVTFKDINPNNLKDFATTVKKHSELKRVEIKTISSLLISVWTQAFDIISHIPNITLGEINKDDSHNIWEKSIYQDVSSLNLFLMSTREYQLIDLNKFIATVDSHDHLQRVEIKTPIGQSMAVWQRVYNSIAHIPHITLSEVDGNSTTIIIQKTNDANMPSLSMFLLNSPEYQQFAVEQFIADVDSRIHLKRVEIKAPYGQSAAIWSRVFYLIPHISYITLSEVAKDYSQIIIEKSMSALSVIVTNSQEYQLFDDMQNVTLNYRGSYTPYTHKFYSLWLARSTKLIDLSTLDDNYSLLAKTLFLIADTNAPGWTDLKHLTATISILDKYYVMKVMNTDKYGSLESFNFFTKDEDEASSVFEWFRSMANWSKNLEIIKNEVLSIREKPQLRDREYL